MIYNELEGNLITLAQEAKFNVIAHGCNCMCNMGAGIAPQMAKAFDCDKFPLEYITHKGDINKLGQIQYKRSFIYKDNIYNEATSTADQVYYHMLDVGRGEAKVLSVVNAYTQYNYGRNHADGDQAPFSYPAFALCMQKINHMFKGMHLGIPKIGAGLAGGDWAVIKNIIQKSLTNMTVTVVNYKP